MHFADKICILLVNSKWLVELIFQTLLFSGYLFDTTGQYAPSLYMTGTAGTLFIVASLMPIAPWRLMKKQKKQNTKDNEIVDKEVLPKEVLHI